jgi:hypothetical protein
MARYTMVSIQCCIYHICAFDYIHLKKLYYVLKASIKKNLQPYYLICVASKVFQVSHQRAGCHLVVLNKQI